MRSFATHALVLILRGRLHLCARAARRSGCRTCSSSSAIPTTASATVMQGFVPAMVAREILIRNKYVTRNSMAAFLSLLRGARRQRVLRADRMVGALALGQGAEEFLGTQGDPWDTQADMFLGPDRRGGARWLRCQRLHESSARAPAEGAAAPALGELRPERLAAGAGPVRARGAARRQDSSARGSSASSSTQSSAWHSAGGSSPIADDRRCIPHQGSMPALSSRFRAW